jgi:hypothetical protein
MLDELNNDKIDQQMDLDDQILIRPNSEEDARNNLDSEMEPELNFGYQQEESMMQYTKQAEPFSKIGESRIDFDDTEREVVASENRSIHLIIKNQNSMEESEKESEKKSEKESDEIEFITKLDKIEPQER